MGSSRDGATSIIVFSVRISIFGPGLYLSACHKRLLSTKNRLFKHAMQRTSRPCYYEQYEESIKTKERILQRCQERWSDSLSDTLDENKDIHEQLVLLFSRYAERTWAFKGDIEVCESFLSWVFSERYPLTSKELSVLAYKLFGARFTYSNTPFILSGGRRESYNLYDKLTTSDFFSSFFFFLAGIPSFFLCLGGSYVPFWTVMPAIISGIGLVAYVYCESRRRHHWLVPCIVNLVCAVANCIWWIYCPSSIPLLCCLFFFATGLLAFFYKKRLIVSMGTSGWTVGGNYGSPSLWGDN